MTHGPIKIIFFALCALRCLMKVHGIYSYLSKLVVQPNNKRMVSQQVIYNLNRHEIAKDGF